MGLMVLEYGVNIVIIGMFMEMAKDIELHIALHKHHTLKLDI